MSPSDAVLDGRMELDTYKNVSCRCLVLQATPHFFFLPKSSAVQTSLPTSIISAAQTSSSTTTSNRSTPSTNLQYLLTKMAGKFITTVALFFAATASALTAPSKRQDASVHSGFGTFFDPGVGACGTTSSGSDPIVAISSQLFNSFPGFDGGNPNSNPVSGKQITASFQGKSTTVTVVDECLGCGVNDLDFSPAAFNALASEDLGRIDITWQFL